MTKKTLIITFTSITLIVALLHSCTPTGIPTERTIDKPYVVQKIDRWYNSNKTCNYHLSNNTSYASYDNDIEVIDLTGRFAIGDTVEICLRKRQ